MKRPVRKKRFLKTNNFLRQIITEIDISETLVYNKNVILINNKLRSGAHSRRFKGSPVRIRHSLSLLYEGRTKHNVTGEILEGAFSRRNLSQDMSTQFTGIRRQDEEEYIIASGHILFHGSAGTVFFICSMYAEVLQECRAFSFSGNYQ